MYGNIDHDIHDLYGNVDHWIQYEARQNDKDCHYDNARRHVQYDNIDHDMYGNINDEMYSKLSLKELKAFSRF